MNKKLKIFKIRNRRRNKHLYEDNLKEGHDYVICPASNERLSMIKKSYIEKILQITVDEYNELYPNQQKICKQRIKNICNGLTKIDVETGLTKHQLSIKKRHIKLLQIGDDGLTGYERYLIKTRESNLNNIIDGKNGYQRTVDTRNNTILKNGLSIQHNGLLKNLKKQKGYNYGFFSET